MKPAALRLLGKPGKSTTPIHRSGLRNAFLAAAGGVILSFAIIALWVPFVRAIRADYAQAEAATAPARRALMAYQAQERLWPPELHPQSLAYARAGANHIAQIRLMPVGRVVVSFNDAALPFQQRNPIEFEPSRKRGSSEIQWRCVVNHPIQSLALPMCHSD